MKILIKTRVHQNFKNVMAQFDENLFRELKPPLIDLNIKRFDGCSKGDEIHLKVKFAGVSRLWISHIVDEYETDSELVFVDKGVTLPPPLKSWLHHHKVLNIDESISEIHDDIEYTTGNKVLDFAIYPTLYLQFYARRSVYQSYFG